MLVYQMTLIVWVILMLQHTRKYLIKVASGEIKIKSMTDITDNDNGNPTKVPVTNVNITYDK